jgi:2Fe-2S ferredoxin
MEGLRDLKAGVDAVCGGTCSCATCHVYVAEVWMASLGPRGLDEYELLTSVAGFKERHSRLSCQIEVSDAIDGLELVIAPQ